MEAAYGLSITVTMLMTTALLCFYLLQTGYSPKWLAHTITFFFGAIEVVFFISKYRKKFFHGGFVAVLIAFVILAVMFVSGTRKYHS